MNPFIFHTMQIQAIWVETPHSIDRVLVLGDNILVTEEVATTDRRINSHGMVWEPEKLRLGVTEEHVQAYKGLIYRPPRFEVGWEVVTYKRRPGKELWQGKDTEYYGIITAIRDGGRLYTNFLERSTGPLDVKEITRCVDDPST